MSEVIYQTADCKALHIKVIGVSYRGKLFVRELSKSGCDLHRRKEKAAFAA